ncbi:hypothetical protein OAL26_03270 [Flavobacteriales bacterium]|nr:hypothetical protein [Flavobacteriales bacterium]
MKENLFLLLLLPAICSAQLSADQQAQVDSLKQVIKFAKQNITIVNAWIAGGNIIWRADPDLDFQLNLKIDSLCSINLNRQLTKKEKIKFLKSKGFALNRWFSGSIWGPKRQEVYGEEDARICIFNLSITNARTTSKIKRNL